MDQLLFYRNSGSLRWKCDVITLSVIVSCLLTNKHIVDGLIGMGNTD